MMPPDFPTTPSQIICIRTHPYYPLQLLRINCHLCGHGRFLKFCLFFSAINNDAKLKNIGKPLSQVHGTQEALVSFLAILCFSSPQSTYILYSENCLHKLQFRLCPFPLVSLQYLLNKDKMPLHGLQTWCSCPICPCFLLFSPTFYSAVPLLLGTLFLHLECLSKFSLFLLCFSSFL